eukprot:12911086-Prorocentrum_lima.AAC.1
MCQEDFVLRHIDFVRLCPAALVSCERERARLREALEKQVAEELEVAMDACPALHESEDVQ